MRHRTLETTQRVAFVLGLALLLTLFAQERAWAQPITYARVYVDSVPVHSGPGSGYRAIATARRGETFEVRGRASSGYWLRIALADARIGFVRGDAVQVHVVDEGAEASPSRALPWLLSPSSMTDADGELALIAGALGDGGMFGARGSYLLEPSFGLEASAGVAVSSAGQLVLLTAGPIVTLWPSSPVQLLATLQAGLAASSPNADTFLLTRGSIAAMSGGVGLRVSLRYGLTLRIELRSHAFVEPDRYVTQEELSAGLAVFF